MPNKRACMFISGKVCLLDAIKVRGQTWPEIIVHARLFGTLCKSFASGILIQLCIIFLKNNEQPNYLL